ncbi:hypothetical protein F5Y08DRAFT_306384 [Xylaria arbuscula]|nr:hypothetical protein F5Y08DRAFT_306384 [Xylaria arbuscula]
MWNCVFSSKMTGILVFTSQAHGVSHIHIPYYRISKRCKPPQYAIIWELSKTAREKLPHQYTVAHVQIHRETIS